MHCNKELLLLLWTEEMDVAANQVQAICGNTALAEAQLFACSGQAVFHHTSNGTQGARLYINKSMDTYYLGIFQLYTVSTSVDYGIPGCHKSWKRALATIWESCLEAFNESPVCNL